MRTDAETNDPEAGKVTTDKGVQPDAKSGIANADKMPSENGKETTYAWKDPIDVTTSGDKTGTIIVTYPDGSTDIVDNVPVHVNIDKEAIDPTVPDKTKVDNSTKLTDDEKQAVGDSVKEANKDQFPEGTQVTIGNDGTATITYPDGSQDIIPGSQLVTKQGSDVANAGDAKNNGQGTTASIQGATADTTAKKLPQTGEQDASATAATGLGLIILSLLGLFGLGSKKRKED